MKNTIISCLLFSTLSLCSCVPFPRSEVRFFEMKGRVIDADMLMPIGGARVAIHDAPSVSTMTDREGRFVVERQRNYYAGVIVVGHPRDIPLGEVNHWRQTLDISAKGYLPTEISANNQTSAYDQPNQCFILKDIQMLRDTTPKEPIPPSQATR